MNNILILQSDNRDVSDTIDNTDYNTLTAIINYQYSQTHNYDFKYLRPHLNNDFTLFNCLSPTKGSRHSSWAKLLSVLNILNQYKQYEYIVYIDSDCIFSNQDLSISDYLTQIKNINNQPLNLNKDFFFVNNKPWDSNLPCAGFFILHNTEDSYNILKEWYNNNNNPYYDRIHVWEQYSLQYHIINKYNDNIEVIDDWMFRPFDNQFLRHIGSEEGYNRIPFFKNYINTHLHNTDINTIITNIKNNLITYNTYDIYNILNTQG
jgi:hypothetical protein